jgi:hypothetical protein
LIWSCVIGGFAGLMLAGTFSAFRGRLAARLMTWSMAASGVLFALAAVLLLFSPMWEVEYRDPRTGGRHAWLGVFINTVYALGPQLTALILGAIAFYILRGARDMRDLIGRGYYDKF